jgi:hypothetical protein
MKLRMRCSALWQCRTRAAFSCANRKMDLIEAMRKDAAQMVSIQHGPAR